MQKISKLLLLLLSEYYHEEQLLLSRRSRNRIFLKDFVLFSKIKARSLPGAGSYAFTEIAVATAPLCKQRGGRAEGKSLEWLFSSQFVPDRGWW